MSSKNRGFAAGLAESIDAPPTPLETAHTPAPARRLGAGMLVDRTNRLADLASGGIVSRPQELVDPARCRMWEEHNRDYARLSEERCSDIIGTTRGQKSQEVPAIVRRVKDDPNYDFEVICGARRHWSVSWLRQNHYPDTRFLIEIRDLTDEEAFRISDLENRAREDLTSLERAADYLRALGKHYGGSQKAMAKRMDVTETWLSRYLDLARLPEELRAAFPDAADLGVKHVSQLKPLLKPEERKARVLEAARRLATAHAAGEASAPRATPAIIRALTLAADAPKKSGSPKKSGKAAAEVIASKSGRPLVSISRKGRLAVDFTLHLDAGASRAEAEEALGAALARHWPD